MVEGILKAVTVAGLLGDAFLAAGGEFLLQAAKQGMIGDKGVVVGGGLRGIRRCRPGGSNRTSAQRGRCNIGA